jgi:DNA ligase-1
MDRFAAIGDEIAARSSRRAKVSILARFLASLDDGDLARAAVFASGLPFPRRDPRQLRVGGRALFDATLAATGFDATEVAARYHQTGDAGDAVASLLSGRASGLEPFSLADAEAAYAALERTRSAADRVRLLADVLRRHRPPAVKYFLKVIDGELRIGLQEKMVEEAIAEAFGAPLADVRAANVRSGDLARVAVAARHGRLATVEAALFRPLDFMLAKPVDDVGELSDPAAYLVEDKLDGIRVQAHVEGGRVALFSRGLEDVTAAFPELVEALRPLPGAAAIDGELLAWREGRALPFGLFQQRLARKRVSKELCERIPVALVAYDLLYRDGVLLFDEPIERRRELLAPLFGANDPRLVLSAARDARTEGDLHRLFAEARARGNEGLVLKARGSRYEAGRRGGAWRKVKRPFATLDVVVTAAERGHGRRAPVLSDVTFAVRAGDRLVNVGKAYTGLTDREILELTRLFEERALSRHGPVLVVAPEVVLEVAFDGVQPSPRHASGFALRFPRIVRWRRDKTVADIDDLSRVEALYRMSLGEGAPEAAGAPA